MYEVFFTRQAVRQLRRVPGPVAGRIRQKIDSLAEDPDARNSNINPLVGRGGYRLRVSDWRIIYTVENEVMHILILTIAQRKEVYR